MGSPTTFICWLGIRLNTQSRNWWTILRVWSGGCIAWNLMFEASICGVHLTKASSVGGAPIEILKRYIQEQKPPSASLKGGAWNPVFWSGEMLGLQASWFSYLLAGTFITFAILKLLRLVYHLGQVKKQIGTYSQQLIFSQEVRSRDR